MEDFVRQEISNQPSSVTPSKNVTTPLSQKFAKNKRKLQLRKLFKPQIIIGIAALFLLVVGGISAFFLSQTSQDVRQQASGCVYWDGDAAAEGSYDNRGGIRQQCQNGLWTVPDDGNLDPSQIIAEKEAARPKRGCVDWDGNEVSHGATDNRGGIRQECTDGLWNVPSDGITDPNQVGAIEVSATVEGMESGELSYQDSIGVYNEYCREEIAAGAEDMCDDLDKLLRDEANRIRYGALDEAVKGNTESVELALAGLNDRSMNQSEARAVYREYCEGSKSQQTSTTACKSLRTEIDAITAIREAAETARYTALTEQVNENTDAVAFAIGGLDERTMNQSEARAVYNEYCTGANAQRTSVTTCQALEESIDEITTIREEAETARYTALTETVTNNTDQVTNALGGLEDRSLDVNQAQNTYNEYCTGANAQQTSVSACGALESSINEIETLVDTAAENRNEAITNNTNQVNLAVDSLNRGIMNFESAQLAYDQYCEGNNQQQTSVQSCADLRTTLDENSFGNQRYYARLNEVVLENTAVVDAMSSSIEELVLNPDEAITTYENYCTGSIARFVSTSSCADLTLAIQTAQSAVDGSDNVNQALLDLETRELNLSGARAVFSEYCTGYNAFLTDSESCSDLRSEIDEIDSIRDQATYDRYSRLTEIIDQNTDQVQLLSTTYQLGFIDEDLASAEYNEICRNNFSRSDECRQLEEVLNTEVVSPADISLAECNSYVEASANLHDRCVLQEGRYVATSLYDVDETSWFSRLFNFNNSDVDIEIAHPDSVLGLNNREVSLATNLLESGDISTADAQSTYDMYCTGLPVNPALCGDLQRALDENQSSNLFMSFLNASRNYISGINDGDLEINPTNRIRPLLNGETVSDVRSQDQIGISIVEELEEVDSLSEYDEIANNNTVIIEADSWDDVVASLWASDPELYELWTQNAGSGEFNFDDPDFLREYNAARNNQNPLYFNGVIVVSESDMADVGTFSCNGCDDEVQDMSFVGLQYLSFIHPLSNQLSEARAMGLAVPSEVFMTVVVVPDELLEGGFVHQPETGIATIPTAIVDGEPVPWPPGMNYLFFDNNPMVHGIATTEVEINGQSYIVPKAGGLIHEELHVMGPSDYYHGRLQLGGRLVDNNGDQMPTDRYLQGWADNNIETAYFGLDDIMNSAFNPNARMSISGFETALAGREGVVSTMQEGNIPLDSDFAFSINVVDPNGDDITPSNMTSFGATATAGEFETHGETTLGALENTSQRAQLVPTDGEYSTLSNTHLFGVNITVDNVDFTLPIPNRLPLFNEISGNQDSFDLNITVSDNFTEVISSNSTDSSINITILTADELAQNSDQIIATSLLSVDDELLIEGTNQEYYLVWEIVDHR